MLNQAATDAEKQCARKSRRHPVTMRAQIDLEGESSIDVRVVDLSYDGCRIELGIGLLPGTKLRLSVPPLGTFEAQVRWYAKGRAGLCFNAEVALENAEKPRRSTRLPVAAVLVLRHGGRKQYQTRVFDLTPEGCKLEFLERPQMNERVWSRFDGLEMIEATVR